MLKSEFDDYTPVERPVINHNVILDPNWISGFVSAEGNFDIRIPSTKSKLGYRVQLRFIISQHDGDLKLMENIVEYFGCMHVIFFLLLHASQVIFFHAKHKKKKWHGLRSIQKKNDMASGKIYKYSGKSAISLIIVDFNHITNTIVPFFLFLFFFIFLRSSHAIFFRACFASNRKKKQATEMKKKKKENEKPYYRCKTLWLSWLM